MLRRKKIKKKDDKKKIFTLLKKVVEDRMLGEVGGLVFFAQEHLVISLTPIWERKERSMKVNSCAKVWGECSKSILDAFEWGLNLFNSIFGMEMGFEFDFWFNCLNSSSLSFFFRETDLWCSLIFPSSNCWI